MDSGKPAVRTQPMAVINAPRHYEEKPNNHLVASVINLICCFFLLGVVALVFSLQVDSAWAAGNYESARSSANIAKILNIIGFVFGVLTWLTAIIAVIAVVVTSVTTVTAASNFNQFGRINTNF